MIKFSRNFILLLTTFVCVASYGATNVARYKVICREWSYNSQDVGGYYSYFVCGYIYRTSSQPNNWNEPANPSRQTYLQYVFDKWIYDVPDPDVPPQDTTPVITSEPSPIGFGGSLPPVVVPPDTPLAMWPPEGGFGATTWYRYLFTQNSSGQQELMEVNYDSSSGQWAVAPAQGSGGTATLTPNGPTSFQNGQEGYINPTTGEWNIKGNDTPGGGGETSADVQTIKNDVGQMRQRILEALAPQLGSWVYDLKISNDSLLDLARTSGIKVQADIPAPVVNVAPPVVNVAPPVVNVPAPVVNVESPVVNVEAPVVNVDTDIRIDQSVTAPAEPELDSEPIELTEEEKQALQTVSGWFENPDGEYGNLFGGLRDFMNNVAGRIPSVGQEATWFTADFDIPFVGHISKEFGWDMFPLVSTVRNFLVLCVLIFFMFKSMRLIIDVMNT